MPVILIARNESSDLLEIPFSPGLSLRDILNQKDQMVVSGCTGNGACGLCKVKILAGDPGDLSNIEEFHLSPDDIKTGIRLACQVFPESDLNVLIQTSVTYSWHFLENFSYSCPYTVDLDFDTDTLIGAMDIGTTTLSFGLVNPGKKGRLICACEGPNPQISKGPDIISRLTRARISDKEALELRNNVLSSILTAQELCRIRTRNQTIKLQSLSIVGNTAMLALIHGKGFDDLLTPAYWNDYINVIPEVSDIWDKIRNFAQMPDLKTILPLKGFIGSDIIAGIIHVKLLEDHDPVMFIDFGTNTEIALWDGTNLRITSASGGPAFEGEGISCGMKAGPGAVYKIYYNKLINQWIARVFGNKQVGICGTGLVDAIAILLSEGLIDHVGRIKSRDPGNNPLLSIPGTSFTINRSDINVFQQAKAAIGTGIDVLCSLSSILSHDISKIYVGGMFGYHLNVEHAKAIGLLPPVDTKNIILAGNTALAGCLDIALSHEAESVSNKVRKIAQIFNLGQFSDFEYFFINNLYLKKQSRRENNEPE